jgi:hypothetical protein
VGEKETHISYSDADGVSFAAIQGLYRMLREMAAENRELTERVRELEERLTTVNAGDE